MGILDRVLNRLARTVVGDPDVQGDAEAKRPARASRAGAPARTGAARRRQPSPIEWAGASKMPQHGKMRWYGYTLRDRRDRVVYVGITSRPKQRAAEHRREGRDYSCMALESGPKPYYRARQWETRRVEEWAKRTGRAPDSDMRRARRTGAPVVAKPIPPRIRW